MIVIISGLYQGVIYYYLSPRHTSHHVPHVPHGGYQYPPCIAAPQGYLSFCKRKRWNQITQLVPGAHFLVARDVLARMWVYNRINIFIYCLFFVFVCLVVGSAILWGYPTNQLTKHKTNNE